MKALLIGALVGLTTISSATQPSRADSTVSIGASAHFWSSALGEDRRLLIYLPPHYAASPKRYPVLYLLDAEDQFHQATGIVQFLASYNGRIPEMIVVGVTNTDRSRDLTPPLLDAGVRKKVQSQLVGKADGFLRFLSDELVPWVDARYRTVPYRILVGHSYGGLFNAYAMVTRPETFQAHIAISPSLWWDNDGMVARTEAGIRKLQHPPWLFVSWGDNEEVIRRTTSKLVEMLTERPVPGLMLEHRYYQGDDHLSTPHRSLYDALELLFAGWRMPLHKDSKEQSVTLDEVDAHYAALSQRFGFTVPAAAPALKAVGKTLLESKQNEQALAVLRRSVRFYPYLSSTHEQLAEALEKLDRKEEALIAYGHALCAAMNEYAPYGDPVSVAEYRRRLEALGGRAPVECR